jgi:hypothetical protein
MKRQYIIPFMEVEQINLSRCLLDASPAADPRPTDLPIGPGAPKRRTTVF